MLNVRVDAPFEIGIKGNQIRLGVDAPKNVSVHREEIYQRIQRERGDESTNRLM